MEPKEKRWGSVAPTPSVGELRHHLGLLSGKTQDKELTCMYRFVQTCVLALLLLRLCDCLHLIHLVRSRRLVHNVARTDAIRVVRYGEGAPPEAGRARAAAFYRAVRDGVHETPSETTLRPCSRSCWGGSRSTARRSTNRSRWQQLTSAR
jgi:hypothetical protein